MKVRIPFKARFREPMLSGVKTMTSRTRCMGSGGDTFDAFGATFEIQHCSLMAFGRILDYWREEGCSSREDLESVWREIHPRRKFKFGDLLWVHEFRMSKGPP